MGRTNKDAVTAFAEVLRSTDETYQQNNRPTYGDNRLMLYFQGMKLCIPDKFDPDALLQLLQVMKKL